MAKLRDIAKKTSEDNLFSQKLNEIGKRKETVHAGGTPLFDEATGKTISPAEYALRKTFKWAKK